MSFLVVFTLLLSHACALHHSGHRLHKRFSGEATYYAVGLGACGGTNIASDFVVALNAPQFDEAGTGYPNPSCGKSLTISHNGKTAQAVVVDKCPGCAYGDLDLSQGLFEFFESTGVGRFGISWNWGDTSAPVPAPTTSTSVAPPPTTSAAPLPSLSPTATTQSSANSSTTSSPSSTNSASVSIVSSSSDSAAPSQPSNNTYGNGNDNSGLPGNVLVMQEAIVNIGSLIRHAAGQS